MNTFHPWNVSLETVRANLELFRGRHRSLYQVKDTFLPEAVLAAYLANQLPGEPVWLMVVGPASSGKTATLDLVRGLDSVFEISSLTEAGLLSGTPSKEKTKEATGGLLSEMGPFGVILCKDFSTILSAKKDDFSNIMAACRHIYDGQYSRTLGVDGGKSLSWTGKAGFIGATTEVIDSKQETRQQLGERFLMFRLESDMQNSLRIARRALQSDASDADGIEELKMLAKTIAGFFKAPCRLPNLPQEVIDHLASLAFMVARARSTLDRNAYTREVENPLSSEEPARLSKQLRTMLFGYLLIGCTDEEALERVTKLALDSMPLAKKRLLLHLHESTGTPSTSELAEMLAISSKATMRLLEDLKVFGLARRIDINSNYTVWELSDVAREHLDGVLAPITTLEEIPFNDTHQAESRTEKEVNPLSSSSPKHIPESRSDCRSKPRKVRAG